MTISYAQVLAAFQPAKEITDPKRFSGRKFQIERGTELLIAGDHVFIYGPRGIGKSSIARQLKLIASGNPELLTTLDSELKNELIDYSTCYLARDASINNLNQLLYRILKDDDCFGQFSYLFEEFGDVPNNYLQGTSLDPRLVSDFWKKATRIAEKHTNGLALFIDEFELIKNHDGFASFLKAGKEKIVFVITGIGSTEIELVRDHKSIERQLATGKIPLDLMDHQDLYKVIEKAEFSISRAIRFTEESATNLVNVVRGQPYLLHLIGRTSLLTAFKAKRNQVDNTILNSSMSIIASEQLDSSLEIRYLKAIGNSPQREIVLRTFAEACNPMAHTSDVYSLATQRGVSNPSYSTGELQKQNYGEELRKSGEKYYKFKDQLFQAYVVATPTRLRKSVPTSSPIKASSTTKKLNSNQSVFEILHFSDIHFGTTHYFSSIPAAADLIPESDKPTFESTIIDAIITEKMDPMAIIISGDLTQNGITSEFNKAAKSLNLILEHFRKSDLHVPQLITCPGNHDVNWASAKADPDAKYMAFQAYTAFTNQLTNAFRIDSGLSPERIYEVAVIESNPPVIFASLNSAVVENEQDHRGYIGNSQLTDALRELEAKANERKSINVAIFHHHLIPVPSIDMAIRSEQTMSDASFVKQKLLAGDFKIALHGHRHQAHAELITSDKGRQLLVIGCGSSGVISKERGEQRLQFNKILVSTIGKKIEVQILTYEFDSSVRQWLTIPGAPKRSFLLDF